LRRVVDDFLVGVLSACYWGDEDRAAHDRDAPEDLLRQANHAAPMPLNEVGIDFVAAAIPGTLSEISPVVEVIPGNILMSIHDYSDHDAS
jgi:hypothetical protein